MHAHEHIHFSAFPRFPLVSVSAHTYCICTKKANANTRAHTNIVHILSGGMKLDLQLNNSSQQITRGSSRIGKKTEHMLVDSCIGYKEMLSYHECS